jgi:hypothetical protein
MGYRSDVAVVIYGDNRDSKKYDLLKTLMNTTFKEAYEAWDSQCEWHDHKCALEFKIEGVKWYDSNPGVQSFMLMLSDIGSIEGLNYEFIRLGEDDTDIDYQEAGELCENLLSITRSIEVDL